MRLLLDEMLSSAIARELRERGYDVLAIADHPGWVALSDPEVMALARTERRAVVTNNLRDYRTLHADAITPAARDTSAWSSCRPPTGVIRHRPDHRRPRSEAGGASRR